MPYVVEFEAEHPLSWLWPTEWNRRFRWRWLAAAYANLVVFVQDEPGWRILYTIKPADNGDTID